MTEKPGPPMRAAVLTTLPAENLEIREVPMPQAVADDDVVIRVEACGVCGTDLHILAGESYRPDLPFVLGHEPVGVVAAAGAGSRAWIGRRVVISLFTGDGTCSSCLAGDERLCLQLESITGVLAADGAYAEYVRVHARQLLEVPSGLTGPEAASLVDAGATAANSVRVARESGALDVLVIGAGPIGFLVAELLAADGVVHAVIEPNELRRRALDDLAHEVVASLDELDREAWTVVIDCSGAAAVMEHAVAVLAPHGLYVLAGYARVPEFDFGEVSHREATIRGVRSGRREDLERVIELAAARRIRLPEISTWPLTHIDEALAALRSGAVDGKAVIVPDPFWKD